MPLPQQKKLVKNGYEMYGFTPEEKFYVISGIRTAAYKDEEKNGDCFSIGKIREGRYVAMISDGMGTGNEANKESKKMIEVMEDMLGAGIEEEVCIQLLDSIIAFETEKEKYATLDFFQLDLFAGIGSFFKIGACPCLLKRKDKVEILVGERTVVGMDLFQSRIPFCRKKMESEDLLVMFSDINSCDFSLRNYCYVSDGDEALSTFSTDCDEEYLLPLIRQAKEAAGEGLCLLATPWSPVFKSITPKKAFIAFFVISSMLRCGSFIRLTAFESYSTLIKRISL